MARVTKSGSRLDLAEGLASLSLNSELTGESVYQWDYASIGVPTPNTSNGKTVRIWTWLDRGESMRFAVNLARMLITKRGDPIVTVPDNNARCAADLRRLADAIEAGEL